MTKLYGYFIILLAGWLLIWYIIFVHGVAVSDDVGGDDKAHKHSIANVQKGMSVEERIHFNPYRNLEQLMEEYWNASQTTYPHVEKKEDGDTSRTSTPPQSSAESTSKTIPESVIKNTAHPTEAAAVSTAIIKKHALVIPYRNRSYHCQEFIRYLEKYLPQNYNTTEQEFSLWVVEQYDDELFNRAWLANVGLAEIFKAEPTTECITFHDIDLIPDNSTDVKGPVWYDRCDLPTQIGSELQHFNWKVPYANGAGGITTLSQKHWKAINGFSNDYCGWGGEDDDLYLRIKINKLLDPRTKSITRPPKGEGRFMTISQEINHHPTDNRTDQQNHDISLKILKQMGYFSGGKSSRWKYDGLSDLQYSVVSEEKKEGVGFNRINHLKVRQQLLEFVRIPKTAGSSIEHAAALANIPWGACHFNHASSEEMSCPKPANFQQLGLHPAADKAWLKGESMWHIPPHFWNINLFHSKKTFTVVRNPYTLAVSIYYDRWVGYQGPEKENPKTLNTFLAQWFTRPPALFKLTQADYVYQNNKAVIDHVVRFENLDTEFASLMKQYNLEDRILLQSNATNKGIVVPGHKKLGLEDLSRTSLQLIELHYARDFDLFGYTKMNSGS